MAPPARGARGGLGAARGARGAVSPGERPRACAEAGGERRGGDGGGGARPARPCRSPGPCPTVKSPKRGRGHPEQHGRSPKEISSPLIRIKNGFRAGVECGC